MIIIFSKIAWQDYSSWLTEDKRMVKKINDLIRDIHQTPFEGAGNPEHLKYDLSGLWSRKIDREHRLVYQIVRKDLLIFSCRYHFDK
jgi:toxin YoeB